MTGRSCWCLELFRSGKLTARNIDVVECSRLAPAVRVAPTGRDPGPALPRERAAVCRRSSARRDEPRDARMAAADPPGAGSADDDRGSGRRGDRAGAPGRAIDRARAGRRALAHRPRRPRHARAGVHGRRAAHRSRPVAPRAAQIAHGPRCGARSTSARTEPRRGAAIHQQSARVAAREPVAAGGARRAVAPVHGRHRRARRVSSIVDVGPLPADVESELFRIASEALTNVRKHADAREASLRLDTVRGRLRLDGGRHGRRFPPARRAPPRVRPGGHRGSRATGRRPRGIRERAGPRHDGHGHGAACGCAVQSADGRPTGQKHRFASSSLTIILSSAKASRPCSSASATSRSSARPTRSRRVCGSPRSSARTSSCWISGCPVTAALRRRDELRRESG